MQKNKFEIGLSLYLDSADDFNKGVMNRANENGARYIFLSVQSKDKSFDKEKLLNTIKLCNAKELLLILDVDLDVFDKISVREFKEANTKYLMLSDRVDLKNLFNLSKDFNLALKAANLDNEDLITLQNMGMDFKDTLICHNYYPKPNTGRSAQSVLEDNKFYKSLGLKTVAFVPGDLLLGGPIYAGLPTIEEHRNMRVLRAILECIKVLCDIVIVADTDISDTVLKDIERLTLGYIEARGILPNELIGHIFYDRKDSARDLIRDSSLRKNCNINNKSMSDTNEFMRGDVIYTKDTLDVYESEVEIVKREIKSPDRILIGRIHMGDHWMLDFITDTLGIKIF